MNIDERREKMEQLEEWISIEGTELGECCQGLCTLLAYSPYLDEATVAALDAELDSQLDNFRENAEIVESVETQEITTRSIEWR